MLLIKLLLWVCLLLSFIATFVSMYFGLRVFYGDIKSWTLILCVVNAFTMMVTLFLLYALGELARGVGALSFLFSYMLSSVFVCGIVSVYCRVRFKKRKMTTSN